MSCVVTYGWYAAAGFIGKVGDLGVAAGGASSIGGYSCEELGAMPELERGACSEGVTGVGTGVMRGSTTYVVLVVGLAVLPCRVLVHVGGASARWSSHFGWGVVVIGAAVGWRA